MVTGFTNLQAAITARQVRRLTDAGQLLQPCEYLDAIGEPRRGCLPGHDIVAALQADPETIALLPASLVDPRVKVLPVDGADPFGSEEARNAPYPFEYEGLLPEGWQPYDAEEIRTLISLGDSCPDRGVAYQAITQGRGWGWVLNGGSARYLRVHPNPVPPGVAGYGWNIVDAEPTGNRGTVRRMLRSADITADHFGCPVVDWWRVNEGLVFSIDPAFLPHLRDAGVDAATLASNHISDQGIRGLLSTLDYFDEVGIETTGVGKDLDEALEPAVVEVNGLRFGFTGFNDIPGSLPARRDRPGVVWIQRRNLEEAVRRARERSDLVLCMPQWGLPEYKPNFSARQLEQMEMFLAAGCDHILGSGTHWAGPIGLQRTEDGRFRYTIGSHGNFLFGQGWSRETSEGVISEIAFRGTELVQVRLHPYFMLDQAQANLTDPETDGRHMLRRIFRNSVFDY